MRWLLTLAFLSLTALPCTAGGGDDAEKLCRQMEKKLRAAKTVHVAFDADITGADAKKGHLKGTLVLGEGDHLRAEAEGTLFGEESRFTLVSDGRDMKSFGYTKAPGQPKQDKNETEKSPKGIGTFFRAELPRNGFCWCLLNMNRRRDIPADYFKAYDFKRAGEEKIGERNTQVIQYTVKAKGRDAKGLSMKLWLDSQTGLPLKLAMTGGGSDITDITETYREFTIDGKVDAKTFTLPK
jgi:outer membrane lipoprotein-sorting protein